MPSSLASFRPHVAAAPVLVRRDAVPGSVWTGLVLDGVVRPTWGGVAVRADLPPVPALRAACVSHLLPSHGVVGRRTAAWVHTGRSRPHRADVLVPAGRRRPDAHPARTCAEAAFGPGDVVDAGGVPVTSVQRTGLDLARWLPADAAAEAVAALVPCGFDAALAIETLLACPGVRHARRARAVLERLAAA